MNASSNFNPSSRPIVAEYLAFVRGSKRGLCPARTDARREKGSD